MVKYAINRRFGLDEMNHEAQRIMLVLNLQSNHREVRGTDVMSANGEEVGSIDKVILDTAHGHIVYVLLDHGRFLGISGDWLPEPYEALEWSTNDQQFRLTIADRKLQQMPKLPKEDLPAMVKISHLEDFYNPYGITPYWKQIAQTTP